MFSAKESLFKCEYPRDGVWLDFSDARLTRCDGATLGFAVKGSTLEVRYAVAHGHAFTALAR